jgi:hypothetical protein
MLEKKLRRAATLLLESAIRIAPSDDTRDWGRAMMGELQHVEGSWAATRWALGGSRVLAKHALVSLIVPGQRGRRLVPDGGLLTESSFLRKGVVLTGGVCLLGALLMFCAASFRQAFGVALEPWRHVYELVSQNYEPGVKNLVQKAEKRQDPEGLAFCAISERDPAERSRWAEEAVRLDPKLTWVYGVVAMENLGSPRAAGWAQQLEAQDPHNALIRLIIAKSIVEPDLRRGEWIPKTQEQVRAWHTAMAAAFGSTKYDDYLDRVAQLNRRVVARYGFYDPYEVHARERLNLPFLAFDMSRTYAQSLLQDGSDLEARGDRKGAREKYWTVARFGQLLDSQGRTDAERWMGTSLQCMAYKQLQASAANQGNQMDAGLFGYLAAKFEPAEQEPPWQPQPSALGMDAARQTAAVVEVLGVTILVFSAFVVMAAIILTAGSLWSKRRFLQRARAVASWVILVSAVGLLLSSLSLYVAYRPYWYMFQDAIQNGGPAQTADLGFFLNSTLTLQWLAPGTLKFISEPGFGPRILYYLWLSLALLGLLSLAFILLRRILGRPRTNVAT